jgi:hypothetical protein
MVNADGEGLCVAHPSTICKKHVRALLSFLEDPEGQ